MFYLYRRLEKTYHLKIIQQPIPLSVFVHESLFNKSFIRIERHEGSTSALSAGVLKRTQTVRVRTWKLKNFWDYYCQHVELHYGYRTT